MCLIGTKKTHPNDPKHTNKWTNNDMCTIRSLLHCVPQRDGVTGVLERSRFSRLSRAAPLGVHCVLCAREVLGVSCFYKCVNPWVPRSETWSGQGLELRSLWTPLTTSDTNNRSEEKQNIKHICTSKCSLARDSMCTPTFNMISSKWDISSNILKSYSNFHTDLQYQSVSHDSLERIQIQFRFSPNVSLSSWNMEVLRLNVRLFSCPTETRAP